MEKSFLIFAIVIAIVAGLGGTIYWYWQAQPEEVQQLQQVALDNPDIKSFDEVCSEKDEYELECKGNIEQFGCERYRSTGITFADLQPSYPMLICEKQYNLSETGVYRIEKQVPLGPKAYKLVDYVIIKDNTYQLIQSEDQFRQLYQPIESTEEAMAYFEALHKASLALSDQQLSNIKYPKEMGNDVKGTFYVSQDSIGLSVITQRWNGYTISAYSSLGGDCVTQVYQYEYLLKKDGRLIEKNKKIIWESDHKPRCIN